MYNILEYVGGGLIVVVILVLFILRKRNRRLNHRYFSRKWRKLQSLCSDKKQWYNAVISADELLSEALKKRHFKGRNCGERLVSAQRYFSSNDAVWISHKLTNKIREDNLTKLTKKQTLDALANFRMALKDLGAFGKQKEM